MARVLLLGPERQRAVGLRGLLAGDGHRVTWLRSLEGWITYERDHAPDILVAAVSKTDGVLAMAGRSAESFPAPLLFVQQEGDFLRDPHLKRRLVDRLASPFMQNEFLARVDALVRVRQIVARRAGGQSASSGSGWRDKFSSWIRDRLPDKERPATPYLEVAARVAEWVDRRDAFEPGHAERVTSFCAMIAEGLRMGEQETGELLRAAMLHDIGKVALARGQCCTRNQPLAESQRKLIRTHPRDVARRCLRELDPDENV